jgi:hypothetical protein
MDVLAPETVMDAGRNADLQDEFEFRSWEQKKLCVHTKYYP